MQRQKKIPIAFLTAVVTEDDVTNAKGNNIGGNDFIPKTAGTLGIIEFIERRLGG